jgi:hypothetical protein
MRDVHRWYALQVIRWIGTAAVVIGGLWIVYQLPVPYWLQIALDATVVTGLIGGSMTMGPVSYRGHQELRKASARRAAREPNGR